MSSSKESTTTLPRTTRRLEPNVHTSTRKQLPILPESSSLQSANQQSVSSVSSHDLVTKYNMKRLTSWFKSWCTWQRRVFTCRVIEHCSKQHLELLATSLEPVLHFDFSSSFSAPLQSLHLDSMATFQVQRTIMQTVINPQVLEASNSLSQVMTSVSSSDSNMSLKRDDMELKKAFSQKQCRLRHELNEDSFLVKEMHSSKDMKTMITDFSHKAREPIVPSLPLIHVEHARALSFERTSASMEDLVTLQRKHFSSVPDFKSTTDLLRNMKQTDAFKAKARRRHHRSSTVGTYPIFAKTSREERRQAELFKEQLAIASNVRYLLYFASAVLRCFQNP